MLAESGHAWKSLGDFRVLESIPGPDQQATPEQRHREAMDMGSQVSLKISLTLQLKPT